MDVRPLAWCLGLSACQPGPADTAPADTCADTDSPTDLPRVPAHRLQASVTWILDYDAVAEGEGYVDCTYTRVFSGVQFLDQPYLCPACDVLTKGTAAMTEGFADCYAPVFGGTADRVESWGFDWPDKSDGTATLYRGGVENLILREMAEVALASLDTPLAVAWTAAYTLADFDLPAKGGFTIDAEGEVTVTVDGSTLIEDPLHPRAEPYVCGWPLGNPGTLATDWRLRPDAVLPTAWLHDACDESVDIWDFHGTWVVLVASQPNCGYCTVLAEATPAFRAEMEALGHPVRVITVLGESLSNVVGEPSDDDLNRWLLAYDDGEPVLKDRGYGYAMFKPFFEDELGYPSYSVQRPDMTVLAAYHGFSSWDAVKADILEDAGK
ncbi:MAG: hypothetical protein JXB39_02685 [Deltaproteobacteria bacterium]|nr:hypothetical protein [Deltaproteobacteria bacterium]